MCFHYPNWNCVGWKDAEGMESEENVQLFLAPLPKKTSVAHLFGIVKAGSSISYGGGEC